MNWEAVGALGEVVGAAAVVLTLVFLAIQLRQNTQATRESNRLERLAAIDRHTDSVNRIRKMLANNGELAEIYRKAIRDEALTELETLRLSNFWVDFTNTQRANFERARAVGEQGLATLSTRSVAADVYGSETLRGMWSRGIPWISLVSPEFVRVVNEDISFLQSAPTDFKSGSGLDPDE